MQKRPQTTGHNRTTGGRGEQVAAAYLQAHGYRILERNYTYGRGEIDLIVRDEKTLVFVEVKARFRGGYGMPEERVTRSKQRQIGRVAQAYLQKLRAPLTIDCRFDVIAVDLDGPEPVVRHLTDAFWL